MGLAVATNTPTKTPTNTAGSPNGTNLFTSCAGVTNNGTVTPAALVSGACAPLAPPSLFTDCSTFGILFPLNQ